MDISPVLLPPLSFSLVALLVILGLGVWLYGAALWAAIDYRLHADPEIDRAFHPELTLLLPLHRLTDRSADLSSGLDADFDANLRAFCQQDYPHYQIVFAVSSRLDPGVEAVQRLIQQFPERSIQLVVSDRQTSSDPKLNLLIQAMAVAQYGLLIVAEPQIRVGSDYLQQIVQPFRYPGIGVVTCPVRSRGRSWATRLEALITTTLWHPAMLMDRWTATVPFWLGTTLAIRRDVLMLLGGFEAIANGSTADCSTAAYSTTNYSTTNYSTATYSTTDYQLGCQLASVGYRVMLSHYVVEQELGQASLPQVWQRQIRSLQFQKFAAFQPSSAAWTNLSVSGPVAPSQTDREQARLTHLISHLRNGAIVALPLLGLAGLGLGWLGWLSCALLWSLRLGLAFVVGHLCLRDRTLRRDWGLLPIADFFSLSLSLWCASGFGRLRSPQTPQHRQDRLPRTENRVEPESRSLLYPSPILPETALDEI